MERIWPVFTSMTTAVPLTELEVSIALANACSDSYCSCESRVSSRPVPGLEATCWVTGDWGSVTPAGDSSIVALPLVPASSLLYSYSSPAAPWPAALVNPTTGAARFPFGTTRLESAISEIPGKASAEIVCPVAWESCRRHDDVPGFSVQLGGQRRRRNVDDGRQRQRGLHRMGNLEVVGHDVIGADGDRQRRSVAVVDAAAQRGEGHGDGRFPAGRRLVRAGAQDLDVYQFGDDEQHGDEEHHAHESHPAREGAALPPAPLARQRKAGDLGRGPVGRGAAVVASRVDDPWRRRDGAGRRVDGARVAPGAAGRGAGRCRLGRAGGPGRRCLGGALAA